MRLAVPAALSFAVAAMAAPPIAAAATPAAERIEIPIKLVEQADHNLRFSIPITVGGAPVEAMLDTGSGGLRLLAGAVPDGAVAPTGRRSVATYGSGVRLIGEAARASIGVGPATVELPVEMTRKIECVSEKPRCPASKVEPERYRIGGDARRGEGFAAILGIGLRPADTPNPLAHIGDGRWIVELPRPGSAAPGRLVLNPTEAEQKGFILHQLPAAARRDAVGGPAWRDNQVPACVLNLDAGTSECAPAMLDTGALGFRFARREDPKPAWPAGVRAAIAFKLDGDRQIEDRFTTNSRPGTRVRYARPTTDDFAEGLNAGFYPYFAFDVLYDAKSGQIGLRPR